MKVFALLPCFVLAVGAVSYEDILLQEWQLYKAQFVKSYDSPAEDHHRMRIFIQNKYNITVHNLRYLSGEETFRMGINHFGDMLPEEINTYNGCNMEANDGEDLELDGEDFVPPPDLHVPESINWVERGAVTGVMNQWMCGSCYAFAALGALEGRLYLKTKKLVTLSVQNIVDCSSAYGNKGCKGGLTTNTFNYVKGNKGINDDPSYPYNAEQGACRFNPQKVAGNCSGYVQLPSGNEEELKKAVAQGPVAVSFDGRLNGFHFYEGGVYSQKNCRTTDLCHAFALVGYGTDAKTKEEYWLVKNSWGGEWGEGGYMRVLRNANNMCGIATRPVYPKF